MSTLEHAQRVETMQQQLEQALLDVGHVKTLLQRARKAACGSAGPQPLVTRLWSLYRSARAFRRAAKRLLDSMPDASMSSTPPGACLMLGFDDAIAKVASIERAAVEEAQR